MYVIVLDCSIQKKDICTVLPHVKPSAPNVCRLQSLRSVVNDPVVTSTYKSDIVLLNTKYTSLHRRLYGDIAAGRGRRRVELYISAQIRARAHPSGNDGAAAGRSNFGSTPASSISQRRPAVAPASRPASRIDMDLAEQHVPGARAHEGPVRSTHGAARVNATF